MLMGDDELVRWDNEGQGTRSVSSIRCSLSRASSSEICAVPQPVSLRFFTVMKTTPLLAPHKAPTEDIVSRFIILEIRGGSYI